MKICSRCKVEKDFTEFNKNNSKKDGYNVYCRTCMVEYKRQNYLDNKSEIRYKNSARKAEITAWYQDHKSSLKCEECGFSHPAALDFHHRDSSTKEFEVSSMPREGYSKESILSEIEKCAVMCANCHRIHHYNERTIL